MATFPTVSKGFVALALGLGACHKEVDPEQRGLFVIANQSGHDALLTVFNTRDRRRAPLTVAVPHGGRVERTAGGGAGVIAYPELYFQGDSVRLVFSDGKQLLHYCPQNQQLSGRCDPVHNLLVLSQYESEKISESVYRYTFTLSPADYSSAL